MILTIAFLLAGLADNPPAAEVDRYLGLWGEKFKDIKTLEVEFRQEKRLKILRKPLVSKGTIRLSQGKLLCTIKNAADAVESILLMQEGVLKIHYPQLNRLEVFEVGAEQKAPAMSFPMFGSDPEALKRDFDVKLERSGDKDRLTLTPRDPKAPVGAMTLTLKDLEIVEVEQTEKNGDKVRMEIIRMTRNPKIAPEDMELKVPAGTQEVHPK